MSAKFKVGDKVESIRASGLTYRIKEIQQLDLTGETYAYRVRRLKGGEEWGPTRTIAECGLGHPYEGHVGLQHP